VTAVRVYDRRLRWPVPRDLPRKLVGKTVERLERRSKYLLFRVGDATLIVHLGMTGTLRVFRKPPPPQRHDHVDLEFDTGVVLRYRDPRRFGAMLWSARPAGKHRLLSGLGPEPLAPEFNANYLHRATRSRRAAVKLALMDSRLVVGVGNIYASEALFRAGIRPTLAANRISLTRFSRLVISSSTTRSTGAMASPVACAGPRSAAFASGAGRVIFARYVSARAKGLWQALVLARFMLESRRNSP